MSIAVRQGTEKDLDAIVQLYDELHNHLENSVNYPGWERGIYPARQDAAAGIDDKCLYVATENDAIIGSIIMRHEQEPAYHTVKWSCELEDADVLVLHTFAVSPKKHRCGVGKALLDFAAQHAKSCHVQALRLDVYENNFPAIKLYEKSGYRYIDTVSLGLEAYGLNWFKLYEKML